MTNANDSAYPCVYTDQRDGAQWVDHGLTKRERFALAAMNAIISGVASSPEVMAAVSHTIKRKGVSEFEYVAADAVKYADALIEELSK